MRREEVRHRQAVERIIDFVELEGVRHAQAGALPFGIQKIVGLARALALEPALLLLDEPSAGLTRDERDDLARFVLRIKHELKLPMIWIEHDMQMVADLADRVHVLNYGRTLASGPTEQVLNDPVSFAPTSVANKSCRNFAANIRHPGPYLKPWVRIFACGEFRDDKLLGKAWRSILPVPVFGRSSRYATRRGYL